VSSFRFASYVEARRPRLACHRAEDRFRLLPADGLFGRGIIRKEDKPP
jgi:hypothetical protein